MISPEPCPPTGRNNLDEEIRALRDELRDMATRSRAQLHMALDTIWSGSGEKVAALACSDLEVDRDEKRLDALAVRILALRHPVATDLRTLTAVLKVITDLERIGDESVNLARAALSSSPCRKGARQALRRMSDAVEQMVANAVRSFFEGDQDLAREVRAAEAAIEASYRAVLDYTVACTAAHPAEATSAVDMVDIAKALCAIARHAANIAQGTLFVFDGHEMPR